MRKMRNTDIELPWQIKLRLAAVAVTISAIIICIGVVCVFAALKQSLGSLFAGLGSAQPVEFAWFIELWPLLPLAFAIVSMQLYSMLEGYVTKCLLTLESGR